MYKKNKARIKELEWFSQSGAFFVLQYMHGCSVGIVQSGSGHCHFMQRTAEFSSSQRAASKMQFLRAEEGVGFFASLFINFRLSHQQRHTEVAGLPKALWQLGRRLR